MRRLLAAVIVISGLGYAQQNGQADRTKPPQDQPGKKVPAAVMRRLEAVTWDPLASQLIWCVSVWDLESDMSKPADLERYVIDINAGVMESNGERRRLDIPSEELHALTNILSTYAMRSTVWWGRTATDDQDSPGAAPDGTNGSKDKTKGDGHDEKPKLPPAGRAIGSRQTPAPSSAPSVAEPEMIAH